MTLPSIPSYPLPTLSGLPTNRVSWRPDPGRAALLIHDMQNHFLDAFTSGAPPLPELIGNIAALREDCRRSGVPVLYSAQPGGQSPKERGLLQDMWGPGIGTDLAAAAIAGELAPEPGDVVLTKRRYSAFHGTGLAEALDRHGRDQLIICGVYAHIGCLMTACEAFSRGIQPFLVADALGDFSAGQHSMALEYAASRCGVVAHRAELAAQFADAWARL